MYLTLYIYHFKLDVFTKGNTLLPTLWYKCKNNYLEIIRKQRLWDATRLFYSFDRRRVVETICWNKFFSSISFRTVVEKRYRNKFFSSTSIEGWLLLTKGCRDKMLSSTYFRRIVERRCQIKFSRQLLLTKGCWNKMLKQVVIVDFFLTEGCWSQMDFHLRHRRPPN